MLLLKVLATSTVCTAASPGQVSPGTNVVVVDVVVVAPAPQLFAAVLVEAAVVAKLPEPSGQRP
ncbi:unannotated protein [freshwater metagenome]|uniref:Unannotated protein n=1 Tax=freshwater metagenome TaxID=449393 RepID=A0A6J7I2J0_9ZZZZ